MTALLRTKCPQCSTQFRFERESLGRGSRCRKCGKHFSLFPFAGPIQDHSDQGPPISTSRPEAWRELSRITGAAGWVQCVAYAPDGRTVLVSDTGATGARLFDLATERLIRSFTIPDGCVCSAAFSSDGSRIALGGANGEVVICDTATGVISEQLPGHSRGGWLTSDLVTVGWSPKGGSLLSCCSEGAVCSWDLLNGTARFKKRVHQRYAKGAISSDGGRLSR